MSPGFALDPAIWFFFSRTTALSSTSGGVAKNVSDIVVTEQQRRPMVTASCVISEHVHPCIASFSLVAACGARKRCVKKWHSVDRIDNAGVKLLGAPIGTKAFTMGFVKKKLDSLEAVCR